MGAVRMCLLGILRGFSRAAEERGAEPDKICAFLDGDRVRIAHAHGKVFYIVIYSYFIEKGFGFFEIWAVVFGVFKDRAHCHEACELYIG